MVSASKRKDQLAHMISDDSYWRNDNGFKDFITDMHSHLKKGYVLSEKQNEAVSKAVKRYAKYFFLKNDPKYKEKIDKSREKITKIQSLLYQCGYSASYEVSADDFLKSMDSWLRRGSQLTLNQRKALNKMYKRFKKRVDKILVKK